MRRALLILLAAGLFILQLSFIPALRPFGIVPNIGIALVALAGLYGTASLSLTLAIAGGLALDLASGSDFGLYVGLFVLVGLTGGYIYRAGLDTAGLLVGAVLVIAATIAQDAIILGGLAGSAVSWPVGHLGAEIALEVMVNTGLFFMLHPTIKWLLRPDTSQVIEVGR